MNKNIKYLLIALAIIALIIAIVFGLIFNAPKASVQSKNVDFTLSASELFQEYSENQSVADQKFIDQIIQISGTIFEISEDQQGATVFLLTTGENSAGVLCTMTVTESTKVKTKKIGDAIILKGFCSGMLMEVVLNRCQLVE